MKSYLFHFEDFVPPPHLRELSSKDYGEHIAALAQKHIQSIQPQSTQSQTPKGTP